MPPGSDVLLDYAAAARLLHASVRTVERLVAAGRLRPLYLTGKRSPRIHPDELRRFADEAYGAIVAAALAEPKCEEVPTTEGGEGPLVLNASGQIVRLASYRPARASGGDRRGASGKRARGRERQRRSG